MEDMRYTTTRCLSTTPPKTAWIYCRVAHPSGFELEMQQALLADEARKRGFTIAGITTEAANGLTLQRKGLIEATHALKNGEATILLVHSISRIGRNIEEVNAYLEWLEQHSIELICADGATPVSSRKFLSSLMKTVTLSNNSTAPSLQ